MNEELLARVQEHCPHEWQYVAGVGRQCQKCSLLWETWAERRIALLESYFDEDDDDDELGDIPFPPVSVMIWTLLPEQTEKTCTHCNGTGQEPFGDARAFCMICSVQYHRDDLAQLHPNTILPCGHALSAVRLAYDCIVCHGSGSK